VGTHSITATYGGDNTFARSTTTTALTQTINPALTTTRLTSSPNPSTSGQAVTFTAVVTPTAPGGGTPTGTVTFQEGNTILGSGTLAGGTATFQTSTLSAAAHQITAVYNGVMSFTGSTSTAVTQTVNSTTGTQNQRFVTQVYRDLLGRDPDPGGLMFFTSKLDMNQATRTQVVTAIQTGEEARRHQVEMLFQKFLGRAADATGLDLSVKFLSSGGSFFTLEATIVGSPEYLQRAGGTNDTFLTAVYRDVLGRGVDATGQSLGSQALNSGTSRTALAATVLTSPEGLQDLVQSLYNQYLHRSADSVGLNASTTALQQRIQQQAVNAVGGQGEHGQAAPVGATVDDVVAVLVSSPEYLGRV
jgi:hypothetical protein